MVFLHYGNRHHAPTHHQLQKKVSLEDFSEPIYTDANGMQFLIRKSTKSVFTYRPATEELVFLCGLATWPAVAKRFGLEVRKKNKNNPTPTPVPRTKRKGDGS